METTQPNKTLSEMISELIENEPAPQRYPPPIPWDEWQAIIRECYRPGWTPAYMGLGVLAPNGEPMARFTAGIVKDAFGIFPCPYEICDDHKPGRLRVVLNNLVFLPNGFIIGLVESLNEAVALAELAGQDVGWVHTGEDVHRTVFVRWRFNGWLHRPERHAHHRHTDRKLPIWTKFELAGAPPAAVLS